MLDERTVELELISESVKLAAIRDHEAENADIGYRALIVEVILAAAYLALVAAVGITAGG